jgi:Ca2+-binding RTX toxin-like protein
VNGGASWTDITNQVSGTSVIWTGVTLSGSSSIMMKVADAAGNDGTVASQSYTLDQIADAAPVATVTINDVDGYISYAEKSAVSFTVTNLDVDATAVVTFSDGNAAHDVTANVLADGTATADLSDLVEGTVTATIAITDVAGNTANGTSDSSTKDTTADSAPVATVIINDVDGYISNTEKSAVSFTVANLDLDATAEVTFSDGNVLHDVTAIVLADGTTTADLSGLDEGTVTATIALTDVAGNMANGTSDSSTKDTTVNAPSAPDLDVTSDSGDDDSDDLTNVATPTVTGSDAEEGATVTLYDTDGITLLGTGLADGSGNWTITSSTLSEGSHTLTVKQTDLAGNISNASASLNVVIDTDADLNDDLSLVVGGGDGPNVANAMVSFVVSGLDDDANGQVIFTDGSNYTDPVTVSENGTYTADLSTLTGAITSTLQITDIAGNSTSVTGNDVYTTIQAAVIAAQEGDTILISSGTYAEQVLVSGKNVTLVGHGDDTVIKAPAGTIAYQAVGAGNRASLITVTNASDVTLQNVKIDGEGRGNELAAGASDFHGIAFINAGGSVEDVTLTGIRMPLDGNGHVSGVQQGRPIYANNVDGTARTLTVSDNTVSDFQKNGVDLRGTNLTVTVTGNEITGEGATPTNAQNGIVIFGPTGEVSGNTVSEVGYVLTGSNSPASSSGILNYTSSNVTIDDNTLNGPTETVTEPNELSAAGVSSFGDSNGASVTNNTISGFTYGILSDSDGAAPNHSGNTFADNQINLATDDLTAASSIVGTAGSDYLEGSAFNDTITGLGGNDTIDGGSGVDTAVYSDAATVVWNGSQWVVTSTADGTETLTDIEAVDVGGAGGPRYLLVDTTATGGFQSLQAAIDAAANGDIILVAPGTYAESANYNPTNNTNDPLFTNPLGLLINKSVTIQGVSASGALIANSGDTAATVLSTVQSNWGTNFYVTAANVTITGLRFEGTASGSVVNKAIEVIADNFSISDSVVTAVAGKGLSSSIYINEANVPVGAGAAFTGATINDYSIEGNALTGAVVVTNGVGWNIVAGTMEITDNEFKAQSGDNAIYNNGIILNGYVDGIGWMNAPIAEPTEISGNTFEAGFVTLVRGRDQDSANVPLSLADVEEFIANNPGLLQYAYAVTPTETALREVPSDINGGAPDPLVAALRTTASGAATNALAGDTLIVMSGTGPDNETISVENLTVKALSGSADLNLTLGATVTGITLADYASGQGADVDVTGNDLANSVVGNSGENLLAGGDGNDTIDGSGGNDTIDGGAGADSLSGGDGDDTIDGGAGTDFAVYAAGATIARDGSGNWTVTDTGGTDTLTGVERVTIGSDTYLLVDKQGTNIGGFQSLQAAIDAAVGGETILVAPGTYTETEEYVPGDYHGVYINKANLTIQGVLSDGSVITSAANAQTYGATIIAGAENMFGANHWIDVGGTGTTISGLHLQAGPETNNKLLEIWANDVTVTNSFVDVNRGGTTYTYAAAIYINETDTSATDVIDSYAIDGNILNEGIIVSNGVGTPGAIGATQLIANNDFVGHFDDVTGEGRYDTVVINGQVFDVGWLLESTQTPIITGNTFGDNSIPFLLRGSDNASANLPSAAQVAAILASNGDANTTYAYVVDTDTSELVTATRQSSSGDYHSFAVTNTIDTLNLALDTTPDNVFGGQRDYVHDGDTLIVQSGSASINSQIMVNDATVKATANSTDLNLTLATQYADGSAIAAGGVAKITLADYVTGLGADVDVTGNTIANTITGNSGNNTITGAGGNDTIDGGANGVAGDTVVFAGNRTDYTITLSGSTYSVLDNRSSTPDGTDTVINVENFEFADSTFTAGAGGTLDVVAPMVTSVDYGINDGTLKAEESVTLTVEFNEVIVVLGGPPTLALENGGSATLTFSTGNSLTFTYTVVAGQDTADLAVTSLNLNGGTIKDVQGNNADLSGVVTNPAGILAVDTIDPDALTITGYSDDTVTFGDGITGDNTLLLSGTAEANSKVKVYDGAALLGTATADGAGAWAFPTAVLADGAHSFTATATDAAGNTGAASTALAVSVDTVNPAAPVITGYANDTAATGDGITGDNTLLLSGTAEANSELKVYDGAALLGTATADGAGAWTFATAALADGAHSFTATATDAAGNTGTASTALAVSVDTVNPAAPVITGYANDTAATGDGITGANTLLLSGTAEANSELKVYDGAALLGTVTADGAGAWTFVTAALADGAHSFTATATDAAGNTGTASTALAVSVDTVNPAAPVITGYANDTAATGDGITGDNTLLLSGTAEANSELKVYDGAALLGTATADGAGAWTFATAALADGAHSFTATATDAAGNTGTASTALAVSVDTVNPAAPVITGYANDTAATGDGITGDNTLLISGSAEANSTVTVYDGVVNLGTATADGAGAWAFATAILADGAHSFTALATDAAGNISNASASLNVVIDTDADLNDDLTLVVGGGDGPNVANATVFFVVDGLDTDISTATVTFTGTMGTPVTVNASAGSADISGLSGTITSVLNFTDIAGNSTSVTGNDVYTTIQAAVIAAQEGDTILISSGTYAEQVLVSGKNVTLVGHGDDTVIKAPAGTIAYQAVGAGNRASLITVTNASDVTLQNVKIDGEGRGNELAAGASDFHGIAFINAGGSVEDVTLTGIRMPLDGNGHVSGVQQGRPIYANNVDGTARTLTVSDNTVSDFQKNGVDLRGTNLTVTVTGNEITGEGATPTNAQNGIVIFGPTGEVSGNTVSEVGYVLTGSNSPASSSGILNYTSSNVTIDDNTLNGPTETVTEPNELSAAGVSSFGDSNGASVTNNTISGFTYGILSDSDGAAPNHSGNTFADNQINLATDDLTAASSIVGTAGSDYLEGSAFNDTITGLGGNDTIDGGSGVDTAVYSDAATVVWNGSQWVVTSTADGTETLTDIEAVDVGGAGGPRYLLVDTTATGGFQSLQAAIDAAANGDIILVAPGTYAESANYNPTNNTNDPLFTNPLGLLINKSVTIQGVSASGALIANSGDTAATVLSTVQSNWGTNFYVTAANVTITGLRFEGTASGSVVNKAIEVIADNFSISDSVVTAVAGKGLSSSIYINEANVPVGAGAAFTGATINDYSIEGNALTGAVVVTNGVGWNIVAGTMEITDNEFKAQSGDNAIYNNGIILNGYVDGIGWMNAPIAEPTEISGNTFEAGFVTLVRGRDQDSANVPLSLADVEEFIANNPGLLQYAYAVTPTETALREVPSDINGGAPDPLVAALRTTASGAATNALAGDTLIVMSGTGPDNETISVENLTVKALSGSADLNLTLGATVTGITLADYASGQGADVDVTGNDLANSVVGNSGENLLAGGDGNDTIDGGANGVAGDTATFTGNRTDYTISLSGAVYTVIDNRGGTPDGTDTVTNVENFQFANVTLVAGGTLDLDAPTVDSVAYGSNDGTLKAGDSVNLIVEFSEDIVLEGGSPTLSLNTGAIATYTSSTADSLTFSYLVGAGQNTSDLAVTGFNLNGATIKDTQGNPADLTLSGAVGNPTGTLVVDTTPPVASITVNDITLDNVINLAESLGNVAVSGSVGGDVVVGDTVTLTVNNVSSTGLVQAGGLFSILVSGSDLLADANQEVDASVTTTDLAGNETTATGSQSYGIDTTPPIAAISVDDITADNLVNIAEGNGTVFVTGTADDDGPEGGTVTLNINGVTYSGAVDGGAFSIEVQGSDLVADADTTVEASFTTTDLAGNSTTVNDSQSYTLDQLPPLAVVNSITQIVSDSGIAGDFITNDAIVTVEGTFHGLLVAGEAIQVSADGVNWLTVSVIGNVWIAENVDLQQGEGKTLTTRSIDTAGNVTPGASHSYTLDTLALAPSFALAADTGDSDSDGITSDGTIDVTDLEDGATWEYSTDAGTSWSTGSGTTFALAVDTYAAGDIQVRQTDAQENISTSSSNEASITVDDEVAAPTASLFNDTGSSDSDGITSSAALTFSMASEVVNRQFNVDGGGWESSYTAPTANQTHTVQVRDTDVAGNVATGSITFTLDTTVTTPTVTLTDTGSSSTDGITNNASLTISVADETVTREYSVNGAAWESSYTAPTANQTHTVQVRDTDVAGNWAINSATFTLDTAAPSAVATSVTQIVDDSEAPGDFVTKDGSVTVSGVFTGTLGSGEKIQVSANGTLWVDTTTVGTVWAAANVALVPGTNTLTTRTIDIAGNVTAGVSQSYQYIPVYIGTPGVDTLTGTGADEEFYGLASNDTINGGAGNDWLDGGAGNDSLIGGLGDDTYVVDATGDKVVEQLNEGIDTILSSVSRTLGDNQENLTLTGSASTAAYGNSLDNILIGNNGSNYLDGKIGADTMSGGKGNDYYWVDNIGDIASELVSEGTDEVKSTISYTLTANVERLSLLGSSHINGVGNDLNNTLAGNAGDNILDGGIGVDTMRGGAGNDIYIVDNNFDVTSETGGGGMDTVLSSISRTLGTDLENLTLTGSSSTAAYGNSLDNILIGNDGNNYLDGKIGVDTMSGGKGNDYYWVDNTGDEVIELVSEGTDEVKSTISYTLTANVERLSLLGSSPINGTGNSLNNTITGNSGNNILDGGEGADTMRGGAGDDTYIVDNTLDVISETGGGGVDTVMASVSRTLGTDFENLTLTGSNAINGYGTALNNVLLGNSGNNILSGGAGNDTLAGGLGNDSLTGGTGEDYLLFNSEAGLDNIDTLVGFVSGVDKLVFENSVFVGLGLPGALDQSMLLIGEGLTEAGDASDRLIYNTDNGALYYDADGLNGAAADQIATLTGVPTVINTDFLIW